MRKTFSRILWAIFFLACAALLVASKMGVVSVKIGFWLFAGTVIFASSLLYSLLKLNITGAIFSIAFLLILYADPLGIARLSPWTILIAATLISVGLNLLFGKKIHPNISITRVADLSSKDKVLDGNFSTSSQNDAGSHVRIDQTMSDTSRYVHSKDLETIELNSKLSDVYLYLDDAEAAGEQVFLDLNVTMSDVVIYLPRSWRVSNTLSPLLSEVDVKGASEGSGPTLIVRGQVSLSEVAIKYV